VSLWNTLPEEVVGVPSVNCFKGRFDRFCEENRFSMIWNDWRWKGLDKVIKDYEIGREREYEINEKLK